MREVNGSNWTCFLRAGSESGLAGSLYAYFFPFILALGVAGNAAAVVLYVHPYLRTSPAIRLLLTKALANIGFLLALVPNFLYHVVPEPVTLADFYYSSLPRVSFAANAASTLANWMTVGVGLEQLLLVVLPMSGRSFAHIHIYILVCTVFAVALEAYPLITQVPLLCEHGVRHKWGLTMRKEPGLRLYMKISTWLHFFLALLFPLLVLAYCALSLWNRLFRKSRFSTAGAEREVVILLALATTLSHLFLEMPAGVVAAVWASGGWLGASEIVDMANFASLTNAALPFFLFLACSHRFRWLAASVFLPCTPLPNTLARSLTRQPSLLRHPSYATNNGAQISAPLLCPKHSLRRKSQPIDTSTSPV